MVFGDNKPNSLGRGIYAPIDIITTIVCIKIQYMPLLIRAKYFCLICLRASLTTSIFSDKSENPYFYLHVTRRLRGNNKITNYENNYKWYIKPSKTRAYLYKNTIDAHSDKCKVFCLACLRASLTTIHFSDKPENDLLWAPFW